MAAFTVPAVFTAIDKMTAPVRKMEATVGGFATRSRASMQRASIAMNKFGNSVVAANNKIKAGVQKTLGVLGQLGVGLGAVAIGREIINANIELDASLQSLQAITGVTGTAFTEFRGEIDAVSKAQKEFSGNTAKAFEIVGSAQPELLASAKNLGMVTNAAITLKKAGLLPMEDAAKALTGTMNQFGLDASQSDRVINVLAAGAKEGSANIRELSESMDKVGGVAKSSNMSLEQTAAAVELMSKFNLKGSEAGVSLKATLLRLKSASLGFASGQFNLNDALLEYNNKLGAIQDPIAKAAYEEKIFGKVHILTGQILTQNVGKLNSLTDAMTGTNEATKQANINNASFSSLIKDIQNSFKNSIVATGDQGKQMNKLKDIMRLVADNMGKIIKGVMVAIKVFLIYKAAIMAVVVVQKVMNAMVGAAKVIEYAAKVARIAKLTNVWAAAQYVLNTAMAVNPIGIIIVGVIALVAIIVLLVKKWDVVKVAMLKVWDIIERNPLIKALILPIYLVIKAIQYLVQNFDKVKAGIASFWQVIEGNRFMQFLILPIYLAIQAVRFLINNFDMVKATVTNVVSSVMSLFSNMWEFIKAIAGFIGVVFQAGFNSILEKLQPIIEKIKSVFAVIKTFAAALLAPFQPIIDVINSIGDAITTSVIDKFKELGGFVTAIIDKVGAFFGNSAAKINAKTEEIVKVQQLGEKNPLNNASANLAQNVIKQETLIQNANKHSVSANSVNNQNKNISTIQNQNQNINTTTQNINNNTREVNTRQGNNNQSKPANGRLDINLNNRSDANVETQQEGTGVNVSNTGN